MAPQSARPPRVPPKIPLSDADRVERERYNPSVKMDRSLPSGSQPRHTNGHRSPSPEGSPTIITTRDLIFMTGLTHSMADLDINHHRPGANGLDAPPASSPQLGTSPNVSSYTPYEQTMRAPTSQPTPRLAPDRYGREIPIDAPWTKMDRSLISSEVLNRAGVRYEARPDFVAVLGRLSNDQVSDFLRQSAECRAARNGRQIRSPRSPPRRSSPPRQERQEPKNSHDKDDDDVLWDSDDTVENDRSADKGTKSYPYIVSPPERPTKASPRGSTTVKPKPILKNKNENHVHFAGTEPYEVDPRASPPRSSRDGGSRRNYTSSSSSSRHGRRREDDDRDERRDRDRDRDRRNGDRNIRKSSLGETIGAVGIGGAAVSLLTVLAQAAVGI